MKLPKEDLKFQISQLRQDKIIYAVEATATCLACVLGIFAIFIISSIIPITSELIATIVIPGAFTFIALIGIGYTIYMGVTNFQRLSKIKQLELELAKAKK